MYGVNKYTCAQYCTETDFFFFLLPELDPDPDLVVKYPDPDLAKRSGSDRIRIHNTAASYAFFLIVILNTLPGFANNPL
jgi:hypothetical protein